MIFAVSSPALGPSWPVCMSWPVSCGPRGPQLPQPPHPTWLTLINKQATPNTHCATPQPTSPLGPLPPASWEGLHGAEAARVSRGTTVPLSPPKSTSG